MTSNNYEPLPRRRKFLLTKSVHPKWYRRYAHVLPTNEIVFQQPAKEIREEAEMIKAATTPPPKQDMSEVLAKKLAVERDNRVKTVLKIMDGDPKTVMASIKKLKPKTCALKAVMEKDTEPKKKPFELEVPPGWFLPRESKWCMIKYNDNIKRKLTKMIIQKRQDAIIKRWQKAIRTVRAVIRFGLIMADIAHTTDEVFKEFNQMMELQIKKNEEEGGLFFDKNKYKSENSKMSLNNKTILTLRNLEILRTEEEIRQAAMNLRVVKSFAEFPEFFQFIMTRIGWYLEVPSDKVIIREGQPPNNFYFLLSGKAVAVALNGSPVETEPGKFDIVRILEKDSLFGEDGMVYGLDYRRYSVTSLETCRLLSVSFDDFNRLVAAPPMPGENAEHISLLSQFEFMRYFPMGKLVENMGNGNIILFYFAPGKIIARKTKDSPFVYIVKKGSAKVFAQMFNYENKRNYTVCVNAPPSLGEYPILDPKPRASITMDTDSSSDVLSIETMESKYDVTAQLPPIKQDKKYSTSSQGKPIKLRRTSSIHKLDPVLAAFAPPTPSGKTGMRGERVSKKSLQQIAREKLMKVNSSFFAFDIDEATESDHSTLAHPVAKQLAEKGYNLNSMGSTKSLAASIASKTSVVSSSMTIASKKSKDSKKISYEQMDGESISPDDSVTSMTKERANLKKTLIDTLCGDDELAEVVRHSINKQKMRYFNRAAGSDASLHKIPSENSTVKLQHAASKEKIILKKGAPYVKWVFLKDIRENDYLGLEDMDFGDEKTGCNVSIVSEGCECILLSKKFFLSNASPRMLAHLRANCDVFPDQAGLHRELRRQQYWTSFKNKTFSALAEKKLHDAKNK